MNTVVGCKPAHRKPYPRTCGRQWCAHKCPCHTCSGSAQHCTQLSSTAVCNRSARPHSGTASCTARAESAAQKSRYGIQLGCSRAYREVSNGRAEVLFDTRQAFASRLAQGLIRSFLDVLGYCGGLRSQRAPAEAHHADWCCGLFVSVHCCINVARTYGSGAGGVCGAQFVREAAVG